MFFVREFGKILGMEKQIVHKAIHLPGLNGLRAIAALSVVIAHSTQEGISDFGYLGYLIFRWLVIVLHYFL